ncbi:MAG: LptF/LptG family permease [Puniceicoccales bacterium]|nr:LptF/LptG family permease [Puniceicoccales bacterium]
MKIYERCIFAEMLIVCTIVVAGFVGMLLAGNAMHDIIEWLSMGRLKLLDTLKMFCILMPSSISYALPLGMMTGILMVVGRMSSQNEILAMKSIGIGLGEIVRPIFLLSIACTLFSAYINLYHAPNSLEKYRQSFRSVARNTPMRFIIPKVFNNYFPGYVIYVDGLSNGQFNGMKIWQFDNGNSLEVYISAKSGEISFSDQANVFLLQLNDGSVEKFSASATSSGVGTSQIMSFKNISVNLPASEFIGEYVSNLKKLRHMILPELLAAKNDLNAAKNDLSPGEIRHRKNLINMQISSHIANAVGILIMTLLAIPLGMKTNRSHASLNVAIALSLCFIYYFIMVVFSLIGENICFRPDILIWVPNIVLLLLGFSLFRRALQH